MNWLLVNKILPNTHLRLSKHSVTGKIYELDYDMSNSLQRASTSCWVHWNWKATVSIEVENLEHWISFVAIRGYVSVLRVLLWSQFLTEISESRMEWKMDRGLSEVGFQKMQFL